VRTLHKALSAGRPAGSDSVSVVRVVNPRRASNRRRSDWPALILHVLALPSGIPPGRSRLEPDGDPAS
jgi:hypothetical protein